MGKRTGGKRTGRPSTWPSHCRIYRVLKAQETPLSLYEIAALAFVQHETARHVLNDLRDCGLAHIRKWRRTLGDAGGAPMALWKFGQAKDATKPKKLDVKKVRRDSWHRRKANIIEEFGEQAWARIRVSRNNGGADTLFIDGRLAYRRGEKCGRHAA